MTRWRWLVLCAAPLLGSACWKSFTVQPGDGGSGGSANTGGSDGSGGDGPGGMGGMGGLGGSGTGGTEPVTELLLAADDFELVQGSQLDVAAPGVLANDQGDELRVVSFSSLEDLPSGLQPTALEIAEDGTVLFEPAADYWGSFEVAYTVEDAAGEQASSQLTIRVAPRVISLARLVEGFGGFVVDGGAGDGLGRDLARTGDANDDGIDDFVIGAPDSASGDGRAFLVLGRTNPTTFQVDVATSRVVTLEVNGDAGVAECLGISVDGLGDVNGDDVPDLVLGAPGCEPHSGTVYVVHGGNTLSGTRDLGLLTDDPSSPAGYRLTGQDQDRIGQVVVGGTDAEADGIPDVLVSTREQIGAYNPFALVGVLSSASELGGDLRTARDLFVTVGMADLTFPVDAARLGDVDDDQRDEVLVGNRSTFAAIEVNEVGGIPEWPESMDDAPSGFSFGTSSLTGRIAGVGDFDGDALPDLVACRGEPAPSEATQSCDLYLGSTLGDAVIAPEWTIGNLPVAVAAPDPAGGVDLGGGTEDDFIVAHADGACLIWGRSAIPSADLDCADLADGDGVEFVAEAGFELTRAALVGDVNGDGFEDLALSAGAGGGGAGRVYIVFGGVLD